MATSNAAQMRRLDIQVYMMNFDTPNIATSGTLIIGVNAVPPIPPRLEMEKQPPCMSSGVKLFVTCLFAHFRLILSQDQSSLFYSHHESLVPPDHLVYLQPHQC